MDNILIVIPGVKKNAVIPDQLIKKLNGITLIQRAINTALRVVNNKKQILIITDSDEIALIAQRNGISFKKDKLLSLNSENIIKEVTSRIEAFKQDNILLYRANTPLLDENILKSAYLEFLKYNKGLIVSVKKENRNVFSYSDGKLRKIATHNLCEEVQAFYIFDKSTINLQSFNPAPYYIPDEKSIEIKSYQNWWICEKILQRKKIVFHVFGSFEIGMGHIFRSLALAHEITDHEVVFVCNEKYKLAVKEIASTDYQVIASKNSEQSICKLNPDIVINDVLDTTKDFVLKLKENGILVVNFEDLGSGAEYADLVFNELYEVPKNNFNNYFWGHKYVTLRDEFDAAKPNLNTTSIKEVIIMFGGTDPNNLTLITLKSILDLCQIKNIKINIICGSGYMFLDELKASIISCDYDNIILHNSILYVSKVMENSQIAISSNGRSIFELAEMNIPSIIISHHEREYSHDFSKHERGFINLGVFNSNSHIDIKNAFIRVTTDSSYWFELYMNLKKYSFRKNKKNIMNKIYKLIETNANGDLHEVD